MCGIAGAIGDVDPQIEAAVQRMSAALRHRGPDAEGFWSDAPGARRRGVAFAHRRLKILDLSEAANQPMIDDATGLVLTFNGEIYNYPDLRDQLREADRPFRTASDTEVLLRAHARWGTGAPARLRGMFAAAVWDPNKRELVLVRDRFGMKPLYTAVVTTEGKGRAVLVASEVRGLLASELVERRMSRAGLSSYVWNGFVCGPDTIIDGVQCVPAGSIVTIPLDTLEARVTRYWEPPRSTVGSATSTDLEHALRESVRAHLQSDVPLGVFLSGGIDSSAVAALASRTSATPVHTFHISFDEAQFDESHHASAVAEKIGSRHVDVRLTQERFRAELDTALNSIDQPTFDAINSYFVSRAVRDAGMTVALAGTGGDELFGGYSSFSDLPRTRGVAKAAAMLPHGLSDRLARRWLRMRYGRNGHVPPQTRSGKLADIVATRGGVPELYQVQYALFTRSFQSELLRASDPDIGYGTRSARLEELRDMAGGRDVRDAVSALEFATFLEQRLLRDTDAASMASSLEVRVPLVDHEVYQVVTALGPGVRFTREPKRALRAAAMPDLPREMFDRPKAGFTLPIEAWCRSQLGDEVAATLRDPELCRDIGLEASVVVKLWQSFLDRAPGIYWSRVWSLFVLGWWARRHRVTL